jgi:hypothetical protein
MVNWGRFPFDMLWRRDLVMSFIVARTDMSSSLLGPFLTFEEGEAIMYYYSIKYPAMKLYLKTYKSAYSELESAFSWFKDLIDSNFINESAIQNDGARQRLLGIMYSHGWGVERNDALARHFLALASKHGYHLMNSDSAIKAMRAHPSCQRD